MNLIWNDNFISILRPFCQNKEDDDKSYHTLYGVVGGTCLYCHPEFISGSYQLVVLYLACKMLKQVQYDSLFLIVEKGTILEPYDKKILANLSKNCNIYCELVLLLKLDTQAYYNMRMVLGYE